MYKQIIKLKKFISPCVSIKELIEWLPKLIFFVNPTDAVFLNILDIIYRNKLYYVVTNEVYTYFEQLLENSFLQKDYFLFSKLLKIFSGITLSENIIYNLNEDFFTTEIFKNPDFLIAIKESYPLLLKNLDFLRSFTQKDLFNFMHKLIKDNKDNSVWEKFYLDCCYNITKCKDTSFIFMVIFDEYTMSLILKGKNQKWLTRLTKLYIKRNDWEEEQEIYFFKQYLLLLKHF